MRQRGVAPSAGRSRAARFHRPAHRARAKPSPRDRNRPDLAAARELARVAAYPQLVDRDERLAPSPTCSLRTTSTGWCRVRAPPRAHSTAWDEPLGEHVLEQRTKPRIPSLQGKPRQRRERNAQDQRNKQQATKTQHHGNPASGRSS